MRASATQDPAGVNGEKRARKRPRACCAIFVPHSAGVADDGSVKRFAGLGNCKTEPAGSVAWRSHFYQAGDGVAARDSLSEVRTRIGHWFVPPGAQVDAEMRHRSAVV